MTGHIPIPNEDDTRRLARAVAPRLKPGDAMLLYGGPGAGKTFFAREVIRTLRPDVGEVPSPTFSLVQTYAYPGGEISHYDLYRLKSAEEVFELDLDGALSRNITIIEWPEIVEGHVMRKSNPIRIYFSIINGIRSILIENFNL